MCGPTTLTLGKPITAWVTWPSFNQSQCEYASGMTAQEGSLLQAQVWPISLHHPSAANGENIEQGTREAMVIQTIAGCCCRASKSSEDLFYGNRAP